MPSSGVLSVVEVSPTTEFEVGLIYFLLKAHFVSSAVGHKTSRRRMQERQLAFGDLHNTTSAKNICILS